MSRNLQIELIREPSSSRSVKAAASRRALVIGTILGSGFCRGLGSGFRFRGSCRYFAGDHAGHKGL